MRSDVFVMTIDTEKWAKWSDNMVDGDRKNWKFSWSRHRRQRPDQPGRQHWDLQLLIQPRAEEVHQQVRHKRQRMANSSTRPPSTTAPNRQVAHVCHPLGPVPQSLASRQRLRRNRLCGTFVGSTCFSGLVAISTAQSDCSVFAVTYKHLQNVPDLPGGLQNLYASVRSRPAPPFSPSERS